MIIECPNCKCQLEILPEHYGQNIQCPNCQAEMTVPNFAAVEVKRRSPLRWFVSLVGVLILAAGAGGFIAYRQHVQRVEAERQAEIRAAAEAARKAEEIRREKERKAVKKRLLEIHVREAEKEREAVEKQVEEDREYVERLIDLSKYQKLSAEGIKESEYLINILSKRYGDLGFVIERTFSYLKGGENALDLFAERAKPARMKAIEKQMKALEALAQYQTQLAVEGE